jgi:hypothetical protein
MLRIVTLLFMLILSAGCSSLTAQSAAEKEYIKTIQWHSSAVIRTIENLEVLTGPSAPSGTEEIDAIVNEKTSATLDELRGLIQSANQMTAPTKFADAHSKYMRAMTIFQQIVGTTDDAMQGPGNTALLGMGYSRIDDGVMLLKEASADITKFAVSE